MILSKHEYNIAKRKLSEEVLAMFESGELHGFDVLWIMNVKRENQLAAAKKCVAAADNPLVFTSNMRIKTRLRGITRGQN